MRLGSKWTTVPALAVAAVLAVAISAYSGASQNADAQSAARPAAAAPSSAQSGTAGLDLNAPKGPWGYSGASSDQGYQPEQPVKFPHPQHVQRLGMNCVYCHFAANKSPDPGMPAVATCMGCHRVAKADSPEIKKLAAYSAKGQPVPWVRIHKVPEYVHFPHMRHVNAGVTCQTCHGQVQKMPVVFQYASLNMGWCVNCHVTGYRPAEGIRAAGYTPTAAEQALPVKKARYDCATCHY